MAASRAERARQIGSKCFQPTPNRKAISYREWLIGQALSNSNLRCSSDSATAAMAIKFADAVLAALAEEP